MMVLYIGDVMGELGMRAVEKLLPDLRKEHQLDLVIAQAENVTDGRGIIPADFQRLKKVGVDFFTGGNWSLHHQEIIQSMSDPAQPIIRPANYPIGTPGLGYKYATTAKGKVLVVSLLGHVVGRDSDKPVDNPLHVIDAILQQEKNVPKAATIVNLHGDFSSEKVVIGYYMDGRATAVIGDHWHVPTADAMVLPKGTAHITDVGMCGALDSSLGVKLEVIIDRWKSQVQSRNVLETSGRLQFNAVLVDSDNQTGLARSITQIQHILDNNT